MSVSDTVSAGSIALKTDPGCSSFRFRMTQQSLLSAPTSLSHPLHCSQAGPPVSLSPLRVCEQHSLSLHLE